MKLFSSLFSKIIVWSFLNLALVGTILVIFFSFQSHIDLHTLFGRQAYDRIRVAAKLISHDLHQSPVRDWSTVLERHGNIYQVKFALVFRDGNQMASHDLIVPEVVKNNALSLDHPRYLKKMLISLFDHRNRYEENDFEHSYFERERHHRDNNFLHGKDYEEIRRFVQKPRFMMRTTDPTRYWTGIWMPILKRDKGTPRYAMLLAVSDSATGNGFFFDPIPWMVVAGGIIGISVLFWIPFVRHITKPLARMTVIAEEIARGRFDVLVKERRFDEIGRLARAIDHMTSRLHGYVKGQKRFLGDVAHELGSPIARIQLGLGIIEQQGGEISKRRVSDVIEDVEHLSSLVNELLSFSRAEVSPARSRIEYVELLPLIDRAVGREKSSGAEIVTEIEPELKVCANPELLTRALANLIRNAVRYAGNSGPIRIVARKKEKNVLVEVLDNGPGVAEEFLDQLFEPFFRPEASRDRDSGGVGLGLAIVKTCIEACKGTVSARNCTPRGFAVTISLAGDKNV